MSESSRKLKERFFENLKVVTQKKEKWQGREQFLYGLIGFGIGLVLFISFFIYITYLE